jgi:hypothetical protein
MQFIDSAVENSIEHPGRLEVPILIGTAMKAPPESTIIDWINSQTTRDADGKETLP